MATSAETGAPLTLRTFTAGDEPALVDLWNRAHAALGGHVPRTVDYWRWCILERPGVGPEDILILAGSHGPLAYGALAPGGMVLESGAGPPVDVLPEPRRGEERGPGRPPRPEEAPRRYAGPAQDRSVGLTLLARDLRRHGGIGGEFRSPTGPHPRAGQGPRDEQQREQDRPGPGAVPHAEESSQGESEESEPD